MTWQVPSIALALTLQLMLTLVCKPTIDFLFRIHRNLWRFGRPTLLPILWHCKNCYSVALPSNRHGLITYPLVKTNFSWDCIHVGGCWWKRNSSIPSGIGHQKFQFLHSLKCHVPRSETNRGAVCHNATAEPGVLTPENKGCHQWCQGHGGRGKKIGFEQL